MSPKGLPRCSQGAEAGNLGPTYAFSRALTRGFGSPPLRKDREGLPLGDPALTTQVWRSRFEEELGGSCVTVPGDLAQQFTQQ